MKISDYNYKKSRMKISAFQLLRGIEGIEMALRSLFFEHAKADMRLMQGIAAINRDIIRNIDNHGIKYYFRKTD